MGLSRFFRYGSKAERNDDPAVGQCRTICLPLSAGGWPAATIARAVFRARLAHRFPPSSTLDTRRLLLPASLAGCMKHGPSGIRSAHAAPGLDPRDARRPNGYRGAARQRPCCTVDCPARLHARPCCHPGKQPADAKRRRIPAIRHAAHCVEMRGKKSAPCILRQEQSTRAVEANPSAPAAATPTVVSTLWRNRPPRARLRCNALSPGRYHGRTQRDDGNRRYAGCAPRQHLDSGRTSAASPPSAPRLE